MTKSKSGGLARLPKEQRCQFLIGPISSWFMPNSTDVWTQIRDELATKSHDSMVDIDISAVTRGVETPTMSYFAYGSIGCFCYGEVHHIDRKNYSQTIKDKEQGDLNKQVSATLNKLIDIREDNSRVICVRFVGNCSYPMLIILTESGTIVVHDCILSENLVQYKKSEILYNIIGLKNSVVDNSEQNSAKRTRFNVVEQINSVVFPNQENVFMAITLLKEKTCLLVRLKFKNVIRLKSNMQSIDKFDIIEECQRVDLDLPQYSSPVCLMECAMLDSLICLIALAMDDGLINVVKFNLSTGQSTRTVKLVRHNDQICSISLHLSNQKKFPSGLLASISRNGLLLIWDIENEFYFADYQAIPDNGSSKINWFALSFVSSKDEKHIHLAVSNSESGITILDIPENARSKIRLKDSKEKQKKHYNENYLRHNTLIFNMRFDYKTETIVTSSLDGSHIFWSLENQEIGNKNSNQSINAKAMFLYPSMLNNSRTHMLRHSPICEDLMALAVGKAGIRFYRIPESTTDCKFEMTPSCALLSRKINKTNLSCTSLAWHPNHEYRLAIGTLEGKVFRADITPRKVALVETQHKAVIKSRIQDGLKSKGESDLFDVDYKPIDRSHCDSIKTDGVYSLTWGPNPTAPQDVSKYAIYAIGSNSHRLFIYYSNKDNSDKLNNYLDEFLDQSLPEAIGEASEVAWKCNLDLMALGTTNGRIIIVTYLDESHGDRSKNKLFERLAVIQGPLGNTYVQCLVWHPSTSKDEARYYYLAASSNESAAFVFNLKETILVSDVEMRLQIAQVIGDLPQHDKPSYTFGATNMLSAYLHKLDAHKKAITDIAWSPHEGDILATASFDRFSYVWSIENTFMDARLLAKFQARDRLFTLEWSLVDADLLFTSGHDSTIWAWRPSENRVKSVASV